MGLKQDYFRSLRNMRVEEPLDIVFYRPLAFLFVRVLVLLPITPNQISLGVVLAGATAGLYLSSGDRHGFVLGALFYGLTNVIDCTDGMVARIKGSATITGRIVDGMADVLTNIAVYVGLAMGLGRAEATGLVSLPLNNWLLCVLAGASMIVHSILSDKYRNLYQFHVAGMGNHPRLDQKRFSRELERLRHQQSRPFDRFLIRVYLHYTRLQVGRRNSGFPRRLPELYERHNRRLVVFWNLIGPVNHITALMLSAFFMRPGLFFIYILGLANAWMVLMLLLQSRADRRLAAKNTVTF